MPAWQIRPATEADQGFVSDMLYQALFVPPGEAPPPRAVLDDPVIADYHQDFARRVGDLGVIATLGATPVGAAWVRLLGTGYGFVDDATPELSIAVVPEQRNEGVGNALLDALVARAPRVTLSVDRRNPAIRLYERAGFTTVRHEGEHSVVMLRTHGVMRVARPLRTPGMGRS